MASHFYTFSLLLMICSTLIIATITSAITPPTTPHDPTIKPKRTSDQPIPFEALMDTGDFSNWVEVLSTTDPSTFPVSATLFIPTDNALTNLTSTQFDPSTLSYHVVPQQLSFSLLKTFKIGSRIPTLLPNKTILVTNNTESNYTLDESRITHPDLYINGAITVHGIGSLLNSSVFGGGFLEDHQISDQSPPDESSSPGVDADDDDDDENKDPLMGNQNSNDYHNNHKGLGKSNGRACNITTLERIKIIIFIILFVTVLILDYWDLYVLFFFFLWLCYR